jgi:hypothetical protein
VAMEEHHIALPKLYGAPAYARPPRIAPKTRLPLDPDDLPIAAVQSDDERALLASLPLGSHDAATNPAGPTLQPRPLSLRALAGRILGQADN